MVLRRIQFVVAICLCVMVLSTEAEPSQLALCDFDCVEVETADIACDTALCQADPLDRESLCSAKCIEAVINLVAEGASCGSEKTADAFANAIDALRDIVSGRIPQSMRTNLMDISMWPTAVCSEYTEAFGSLMSEDLYDDMMYRMLSDGL